MWAMVSRNLASISGSGPSAAATPHALDAVAAGGFEAGRGIPPDGLEPSVEQPFDRRAGRWFPSQLALFTTLLPEPGLVGRQSAGRPRRARAVIDLDDPVAHTLGRKHIVFY
jgi:hypothetical protein